MIELHAELSRMEGEILREHRGPPPLSPARQAEDLFLSEDPPKGVLKIANLEFAVEKPLTVDPDDGGRSLECKGGR